MIDLTLGSNPRLNPVDISLPNKADLWWHFKRNPNLSHSLKKHYGHFLKSFMYLILQLRQFNFSTLILESLSFSKTCSSFSKANRSRYTFQCERELYLMSNLFELRPKEPLDLLEACILWQPAEQTILTIHSLLLTSRRLC